MRKFVKFVSIFPFAGKMAIRPMVRSFIKATPGVPKVVWAFLTGLLLKVLILGHSRQAWMGIRVLMRSMGRARMFWQGVFVTYIVVNVAVTIVQVYLLIWVWYICVKNKKTKLLGPSDEYSLTEVVIMLAVTLGGQMLFITGYKIYMPM